MITLQNFESLCTAETCTPQQVNIYGTYLIYNGVNTATYVLTNKNGNTSAECRRGVEQVMFFHTIRGCGMDRLMSPQGHSLFPPLPLCN